MTAVPLRQPEPPLPIVIVGHVDHGKSTLVGRLLHDTDSLPVTKIRDLQVQSERRGMPFEWSFVLDALQIERDQGITLDTTRIWFRSARRGYVIIDAPGHKEFLKNMVTGAASADAAVLVIDAEQGVSEQTRRHAYLLSLLGLSQVVVAINKMDLVGYDQGRFAAVAAEIGDYLGGIGIAARQILPIAARHGENVAKPATLMPWWQGGTLVEALDSFKRRPSPIDRPLRLPIQDIYRRDDRRILVGRIESGRLRVGDTLSFSPGGGTARVTTIESWNSGPHLSAGAGRSVAITLNEPLFVERGHIASHAEASPQRALRLRARLFWLSREPLEIGATLTLKLTTASHTVVVEAIERVIDVQDLQHHDARRIEHNGVAEVILKSRTPVIFDPFSDNQITGRGVLVQGFELVGGCILDAAAALPEADAHARQDGAGGNLTPVASSVDPAMRAANLGHTGGVLWLTGLSGAGKSTLAMALQRRLFERGFQASVLDGDNLRQGLNSDLGFTPEARAENIRRTAEVARLFADTGVIAIVSLISPFAADRSRAREIVGPAFLEIHVKASLDTCRTRDPKGLYARAGKGEIANFTGVSAPYEAPVDPDLVIDTDRYDIEASLALLLEEVEACFRFEPVRSHGTV